MKVKMDLKDVIKLAIHGLELGNTEGVKALLSDLLKELEEKETPK